MKAATEGYQDALRSGDEALIGQYEIIIDPVAARKSQVALAQREEDQSYRVGRDRTLDARADARQAYTVGRDKILDERAEEGQAYRVGRDETLDARAADTAAENLRRYEKGLEDAETKRLGGSRPSFTRVGGRVAKITVGQWEADQRLPASEQKYTSTGPETRVKVWRVVEGGPAVETSAPISVINNPENKGKYTYDKPPTVKADTMGKFYDSLTKKMVQIPRSVYDADPSRYSEVPEPPEEREPAFRLNVDGTYEEVRATVKEIEDDPNLLFSKPPKPERPISVRLVTPVNGRTETFVTLEALIEDMGRLPGEQLYLPPSGMRISKDGRLTNIPGVSEKFSTDATEQAVNNAFHMANVSRLLENVQDFPGLVGFRGQVGSVASGIAGQVPGVGAEFGKFVSNFITGANPEQIAAFKFNARILIASLIPQIAGEESGRYSGPELAITQEAARILSGPASAEQSIGALKASIKAYAVHGAKASYIANNRYRLKDKEFLEPLIENLYEAGLTDEDVKEVLIQMRSAYRTLDKFSIREIQGERQ
tara:strand:- start:2253 stop:3875 length:1623 start_codon:yes stop_codon:yes gene_type:complete